LILYYAVGGGYGHYSRAISYFHTNQIHEDNFLILCNPELQSLSTTKKNILSIKESDLTMFDILLSNIVRDYSIDEIIIDTFPMGILGEWIKFQTKIPKKLILRNLNIKRYLKDISIRLSKQIDFPFLLDYLSKEFKVLYQIEPISVDYYEIIYPLNKLIKKFVLQNDLNIQIDFSIMPEKYFLVVHSGSLEELENLVFYAIDYKKMNQSKEIILIISAHKIEIDDCISIKEYPAKNYFQRASKIITACGFNSIFETISFRDKHLCIPFPRRYDDQFYRKKNLKLFDEFLCIPQQIG
jgi:predicted glycosyltransferase